MPESSADPGRDVPAVYLHIGLHKTGTTYLQAVMWANREQLAADGICYPGDRRIDQTMAVADLFGRRPRGTTDPRVAGTWARLAREVADWPGPTAVISSEYLGQATGTQARRVVRSFPDREVHVVVTVRDLGRVVTAMWQEDLKHDTSWALPEYVDRLRDPERAAQAPARGFWLRQGLLAILDRWEAAVPRERVHLVTVPPAGSAPDLLLHRFASVTGLRPERLVEEPDRANESVGLVGAEVLRQVNLRLGGRLNQRQYDRAVKNGVAAGLRERPDPVRIGLPPGQEQWVAEQERALSSILRERGYDVAGDLGDLVGSWDQAKAGTQRQQVAEADLADAALDALAWLAEAHATAWWARRRLDTKAADAGPVTRLASGARGAAYRTKRAAVEVADRNPVVGRALRGYLRRTGRLGRAGR